MRRSARSHKGDVNVSAFGGVGRSRTGWRSPTKTGRASHHQVSQIMTVPGLAPLVREFMDRLQELLQRSQGPGIARADWGLLTSDGEARRAPPGAGSRTANGSWE